MCCLEAVLPVSLSSLEPQFPHLWALLLIQLELFEAGMQRLKLLNLETFQEVEKPCQSHCQPPGKITFPL